VLSGSPRFGAQATSRTQSVWPDNADGSCSHRRPASLKNHTCMSDGAQWSSVCTAVHCRLRPQLQK